MINGALPPNSNAIFLILDALCSINSRPISVEPVKVIFLTFGLPVNSPPISTGEPVTMLKTPAGNPASKASFPNASAVKGVSSDGFSTTVQPAAKAGAIFLVTKAEGKFQAIMAPQTPIGCFIANNRCSLFGVGSTSPYNLLASSANHSTNDKA